MFHSILIPVDVGHTEKAERAIALARQVAGKDAKLRLISVIEEVPTFIASQIPPEVFERNKSDADEILRDLGKKAIGPSGFETEVRTGRPGSAIVDAAKACGADLIVIGSHKPGMQDLLLGSTAAYVVRHATCTVTVIR